MKVKLLLIILLFPFLANAQNQFKNFILENGSLSYVQVFPVDSLKEPDLIKQLNSFLPTVSGVTNVQNNEGVFTGRIENQMVDYKKYGGSWGGTWLGLNHPMTANMNVQVKDGKYRLQLTNIVFHAASPKTDFDLSSAFTKQKGTILNMAPLAQKAMGYMDGYFTNQFKLAAKKDW